MEELFFFCFEFDGDEFEAENDEIFGEERIGHSEENLLEDGVVDALLSFVVLLLINFFQLLFRVKQFHNCVHEEIQTILVEVVEV